MQTGLSRREFLKLSSAAALLPIFTGPFHFDTQAVLDPAPASFGRITTGLRQAVRTEASLKSGLVAWKVYDDVIPLYATTIGDALWPSNAIWYQTDGGFIHSAFVQPVENTPTSDILTNIIAPGIWTQVCVPIAVTRSSPAAPWPGRKIYYGCVYRAVGTTIGPNGDGWYQLQDGITYRPGPFVPASSMRYIPQSQLEPISVGVADKRIEVNLKQQQLTAFEGDNAVFTTRVASGYGAHFTPIGEHFVIRKQHTAYMIGGEGSDAYDLPGVSFPVYFTYSGCATHGTYWHNDYGRPRSHGCVNVTNQAAQWLFRWTEPAVPYTEYGLTVKPNEGTKVVVV
jgi:lipoprotein-anchoring transpeptidase ErfK/SrfK